MNWLGRLLHKSPAESCSLAPLSYGTRSRQFDGAVSCGLDSQPRYRIRWIGTPNLSFFHDLSAVYTGALRTIPRARQARSPNDKPSGRVLVIRFPAASACSAVKAVASRMGLSVASHASPGASPMLTSLPCTSARLTVLLVAVLNISEVSLSAPGSRFSTASRAEASRTILFIPSRLAPFGNQLVSRPANAAEHSPVPSTNRSSRCSPSGLCPSISLEQKPTRRLLHARAGMVIRSLLRTPRLRPLPRPVVSA